MNSKIFKAALLISLLFNITFIFAAGYFYYRDNICGVSGRMEKRQEVFAKKLGLTTEQREKMKLEDSRFRAAVANTRAELMAKRKSLLNVLKQDRPDRAAIDAILADIVALQGKTEAQAVEHMINEKSVLDKEQQARFADLLEKRLEKSQSRWERHHGRGLTQ